MDIYRLSENRELECKEASKGLPKDMWETYSAFANSNGGIILLGIKEKKGEFHITGIDNIDDMQKDLWDNLNNKKKVSINIIDDNNVTIETYEGKNIIKIVIPRADRRQKPVYIGENPYSDNKHGGTFRRNHSGDYKCNKSEVDRMIADSSDFSQDSLIIEGYTIDDLNIESINNYKNRLSVRKPSHPWLGLDVKNFLYKLGAYGKDRQTGVEGITVAGLLMFGEEREITDEFPKYFLDYREKTTDNRWDYRITSSDGIWSGNIYDFYFKTINRITDNLNLPFRLINGIRQDNTDVHDAIREAVANTIIHADYRLERGIVIERGKTYFKFANQGSLRISKEEAMDGGISDPRNENIFKMFNLIGVGERAGSGIETIRKAWKNQEWIIPDLEESFSPDRVVLTLRTVPLVPKDRYLVEDQSTKDDIFMEVELSIEETEIMNFIESNGFITNKLSREKLGFGKTKSTNLFKNLIENGKIEKIGNGSKTQYIIKNTNKCI